MGRCGAASLFCVMGGCAVIECGTGSPVSHVTDCSNGSLTTQLQSITIEL